MKRKLSVVYLCITFMLVSCIPFTDGPAAEAEPVYNSNIVWKTEIAGRGSYAENLYTGGYAYIQESSFLMRNYDGGPFCRVVKVRLSDGEVVWRTEDIAWECTDNMAKVEGRIYVPVSETGLLYAYSDESGELQAAVKLGNTGYEAEHNGPWSRTVVSSGPYLFWGKKEIDGGLMRFDTRRVDYNRGVSKEQILEPAWVFNGPEAQGIKNIIEEDGIIYFLTANGMYNFNEGYSILCAMEAETAKVIWRKELSHIDGFIPNSLVINGEYLHVIDKAPSCYRKADGEAVYEFDDRTRDPQKDPYLSGANLLPGISVYDNKLYYCTNIGVIFASMYPEGLSNNIICLDAMTGKLVWGDLVPKGGSPETCPVIINGKAFALVDRGLRVYDARTGRLIGMDENIRSRGDTANYGYGDMFIGFDIDHTPGDGEPDVSHLIAIRAE
jgi:outer membrane protein assembly factor BamB